MKVKDLKEGYLYKDYSKRGHCKNGTFTIKIAEKGVWVYDTYWSNPEYRLATDEYVKDFEEILKLDDYNRVNGYDAVSDYLEEDYIQVHKHQCSGRFPEYLDFFLKKGAVKNSDIVKKKLERHIENLTRKLKNSKEQLKQLENGEIKPSQVYIF